MVVKGDDVLKVKIFIGSYVDEVENAVNQFITNEEVDKIIDVKQSESFYGQSWRLSLTLIYEERKSTNEVSSNINVPEAKEKIKELQEERGKLKPIDIPSFEVVEAE